MISSDAAFSIQTSPDSSLTLLEAWTSASSLLCHLPLPMARVYEYLKHLSPEMAMTWDTFTSATALLCDLIPAAFDLRSRDLNGPLYLHFFDHPLLVVFKSALMGDEKINLKPETKIISPPIVAPVKNSRDRLNQLLSIPSHSFGADNSYDFNVFLARRPAMAQLLSEVYQSRPPHPFVGICPHWPTVNWRSTNNNTSSNNTSTSINIHRPAHSISCANKIKFTAVVAAQTDPNLGDCSYLDTCFKAKGCRYLHYRVEYPRTTATITTATSALAPKPPSEVIRPYMTLGEPLSGALRRPLPPQWINCDILNLDFTILGKFAAIVIDPPWDIHTNGTDRSSVSGVSDEDMINLPVHQIQDEGICVLWVTGRALEIGRQCLNAWGYTTVRELLWIKTNQVGRTICTGRTGHWLNHTKEHALVGVRAKPNSNNSNNIPEWIHGGIDLDVLVAGTRTKSRKPDELYDIVERLVDGPWVVKGAARKLELFGKAHNLREGWLTIGNEVSDNADDHHHNNNNARHNHNHNHNHGQLKFNLQEPSLRRAYESTRV